MQRQKDCLCGFSSPIFPNLPSSHCWIAQSFTPTKSPNFLSTTKKRHQKSRRSSEIQIPAKSGGKLPKTPPKPPQTRRVELSPGAGGTLRVHVAAGRLGAGFSALRWEFGLREPGHVWLKLQRSEGQSAGVVAWSMCPLTRASHCGVP